MTWDPTPSTYNEVICNDGVTTSWNTVHFAGISIKKQLGDELKHSRQRQQRSGHLHLEGTPYQHIKTVGTGAYGTVCSAVNKITGEQVAIKKIFHVFADPEIAKRTLREIRLLRHFRHPNIVSIRDIVIPGGSDLYLILELMPMDLLALLKSGQPVSVEHVQYIFYQLLCGLKYIHSVSVAHRDLKPSNLLIDANCQLKIGDFGMARHLASCHDDQSPTLYVATRWYRAPELLMRRSNYTTAVDMWSAGCILGELLLRRALFPGQNPCHQVCLIAGRLGSPPPDLASLARDQQAANDLAAAAASAPPLAAQLPAGTPPDAVQLLGALLSYAPAGRPSATDALDERQPWTSFLAGWWREGQQPHDCPAPPPPQTSPSEESSTTTPAERLLRAIEAEARQLTGSDLTTMVTPPPTSLYESASSDADADVEAAVVLLDDMWSAGGSSPLSSQLVISPGTPEVAGPPAPAPQRRKPSSKQRPQESNRSSVLTSGHQPQQQPLCVPKLKEFLGKRGIAVPDAVVTAAAAAAVDSNAVPAAAIVAAFNVVSDDDVEMPSAGLPSRFLDDWLADFPTPPLMNAGGQDQECPDTAQVMRDILEMCPHDSSQLDGATL